MFLTYARSIQEQVSGNPVCRLTLVSGGGHRNLLKHLNYQPLGEMLNRGGGGGALHCANWGWGQMAHFQQGGGRIRTTQGGGVGLAGICISFFTPRASGREGEKISALGRRLWQAVLGC